MILKGAVTCVIFSLWEWALQKFSSMTYEGFYHQINTRADMSLHRYRLEELYLSWRATAALGAVLAASLRLIWSMSMLVAIVVGNLFSVVYCIAFNSLHLSVHGCQEKVSLAKGAPNFQFNSEAFRAFHSGHHFSPATNHGLTILADLILGTFGGFRRQDA